MFHQSSCSSWWQMKFDIIRVRNIPTTSLIAHFWIYTSYRALSVGSGVLSRRAGLRSHNSCIGPVSSPSICHVRASVDSSHGAHWLQILAIQAWDLTFIATVSRSHPRCLAILLRFLWKTKRIILGSDCPMKYAHLWECLRESWKSVGKIESLKELSAEETDWRRQKYNPFLQVCIFIATTIMHGVLTFWQIYFAIIRIENTTI